MLKVIRVAVLTLLCFHSFAQQKTASEISRPRLVVGIVVDQMRWDYLYRFYDRYSKGGFKRLLQKGFSCNNTFIPYTPTYTAPGHTCVYTGSVPAIHGIIGNNWYDRSVNKVRYCTEDTTATPVGGSRAAGRMSPANLWTSTITDELRLATNQRSKTVGIAIKDRGAILPAGHSANAAYWFDDSTGNFMTSSYYMAALPEWVKRFNEEKKPDQYLAANWTTLFPINSYRQSTVDSGTWESTNASLSNAFPHNTAAIGNNRFNVLRFTPWGNNLTLDMSRAAIEGEQLGSMGNTDFLAISFSSPDYIGHFFGPNSIELEDNYLRLDRELEKFFSYLDDRIGKGQYLLFLTADHAAAHSPGYLAQMHMPGGNVEDAELQQMLNQEVEQKTGVKKAVEKLINYQVYIRNEIDDRKREEIVKLVIVKLLSHPGIAMAVELKKIAEAPIPETVKKMIINGYNQRLSGDIQFVLKPHWLEGSARGTTHGSWNPYDSHIPLLWYGWGIKKGSSEKRYAMTDIAATLAALLKIQIPSGCVGQVISELAP